MFHGFSIFCEHIARKLMRRAARWAEKLVSDAGWVGTKGWNAHFITFSYDNVYGSRNIMEDGCGVRLRQIPFLQQIVFASFA